MRHGGLNAPRQLRQPLRRALNVYLVEHHDLGLVRQLLREQLQLPVDRLEVADRVFALDVDDVDEVVILLLCRRCRNC